MNMKVVLVWGFAILLFASIGIFGLVNQDLLIEEDQNDFYVPNDSNDIKSKTCNATTESGLSAYRFQVDENGDISKVIMTYTAKVENIDVYSSASNINNTNIFGIETILNGGAADFVLIVTVDLKNYDKVALETILQDLNKVSMLIDGDLTNYDTYKEMINQSQAGTTYVCD